jgi:5-methylcytosine-specific restriction protein A
MPTAPFRPCLEPHCGVLVPPGRVRCATHSKALGRGSRTARGYDEDYQRLRRVFMAQPENQLCRSCLTQDRITLATDCDHIVPFRGRSDPRRLDTNNLQPLCRSCHSIKTMGGRFGV